MAELDGLGIAAVFAADADLEVGAGFAALDGRHLDELADAVLIERGEGVLLEDSLGQVLGQELVDVVAREAEGGLGEVVGSEAEELGLLGDLVGDQSGAGKLDHGADEVFDAVLLFGEDFLGDAADDVGLILHLLEGGGERNHDLRNDGDALLLELERGLDDGARLHLGDLRVGDAETAATVAEHGVLLMQFLDAGEDDAQLLELGRAGLGELQLLDLDEKIFALGQELVERRIEGADGDRESLHGLEESGEVGALHGEQFLEGGAAVLLGAGHDHGAHEGQTVLGEEHVLGAAEADAFGAEGDGGFGVAGNVGIGADARDGGGDRPRP